MDSKERNCDASNVNSKTTIGLTFKEIIWIITLIVGAGISYADIKSDYVNTKSKIEDLDCKYTDITKRQELYENELKLQKEKDNKIYENILVELEKIRGDLKLKQNRYK